MLERRNIGHRNYDFAAAQRYYSNDPYFQAEDSTLSTLLPNGHLAGVERDEAGQLWLCGENLQEDAPLLERIFQLEAEPERCWERYRSGKLAALLERYRYLPLLRDLSPQHSLLRTIIHQQVSMAAAYTVTRRFMEHFGEQRQGICGLVDFETLRDVSEEQFRALGLGGRRAATMHEISQALLNGTLILPQELADEDDYQALSELLLPYKGIGPWTVQCLALSAYSYPHLVPIADLGLQEALKSWYELPQRPDRAWMQDWAEQHRWGGSYLTFYLWQWRRAEMGI